MAVKLLRIELNFRYFQKFNSKILKFLIELNSIGQQRSRLFLFFDIRIGNLKYGRIRKGRIFKSLSKYKYSIEKEVCWLQARS
jgi:hypothetical protein